MWLNLGGGTSSKILMMANELIEKQTLVQMWKLINFEKPVHVFHKMEIENDMTISTKRVRLQTVDLGFRWRGTRQWNNLPDTLRQNHH